MKIIFNSPLLLARVILLNALYMQKNEYFIKIKVNELMEIFLKNLHYLGVINAC